MRQEEDRRNQRFPPPPDYYKDFSKPDAHVPPSSEIISNSNCFKTFGVEYKNNEINNFFNKVDIQYIKGDIPNKKFFQQINANIKDFSQNYVTISESALDFNVLKELENEFKLLKENYKELLKNLCVDIEKCDDYYNLIFVGIQKIYFYIGILKKKKILSDVIKFFRKEIDKNTKLEEQLNKNIQNFQDILTEGINAMN